VTIILLQLLDFFLTEVVTVQALDISSKVVEIASSNEFKTKRQTSVRENSASSLQ